MKTLLVVDKPKYIDNATIARQDLEGNNPLELEGLCKSINKFSEVVVITDLEEFTSEIILDKNILVFPMYWGQSSQLTKGHVPSICEANHIDYLGPDSYTCLLCNDKYTAKKYVEAFHLQTPKSVMLRKNQSQKIIHETLLLLDYPIVIKPNFGGGSSGISNHNIVNDFEGSLSIIQKLFACGFTHLIAEEYVDGYEVSLLLVGDQAKIRFQAQVQLEINSEAYFKNKIWGFEDKKVDFTSSHYKVCQMIPNEDIDKAIQLFQSFKKLEYIRIDGRVNSKGFHVIELTPDCYMGPNCDFHIAFTHQQKSYDEFIKFIFENHSSQKSGEPQ